MCCHHREPGRDVARPRRCGARADIRRRSHRAPANEDADPTHYLTVSRPAIPVAGMAGRLARSRGSAARPPPRLPGSRVPPGYPDAPRAMPPSTLGGESGLRLFGLWSPRRPYPPGPSPAAEPTPISPAAGTNPSAAPQPPGWGAAFGYPSRPRSFQPSE